MLRRIHFIIFVFVIYITPAFTQENLKTKIDSFISGVTGNDRPGFAVGVIYNGEIIVSSGYGLASLEHNVPFVPETISDIGSVAKQFTCLATLILADQGQLALDDDIRIHLPWVPDFGETITIRHLVHHTSGLREVYAAMAVAGWRGGDGIIQEDAKLLVENSRELNFKPGDKYLYCNTAYMLLADIVEKVTGLTFEVWMSQNIFSPLKMQNTYIMDVAGETFSNCAESYIKNEDGKYVRVFDNSAAYGQGGIYTSLVDMLKWVQNYFSFQVGGKGIMQRMFQRGVLNNGDTLSYACGLVVGKHQGQLRIGHGGSSAGYRASLSFYPNHKLGIVMKSNTPGIDFRSIEDLIINFLLGDQLTTQVTEASEEVSEEKEDHSEPQKFDEFTGEYYSPELETTYRLKLVNEKLVALHRRHGKLELNWVGQDQFQSDSWFFSNLKFERNSEREITGFRLSNGRVNGLQFIRF